MVDQDSATGSGTLSLPAGTWKVDWVAVAKNDTAGRQTIVCDSANLELRSAATFAALNDYASMASTNIIQGPAAVKISCNLASLGSVALGRTTLLAVEVTAP